MTTFDHISSTPTTASPETGPLRDLGPFTVTVKEAGLPEGKATYCLPGIIVRGADPGFVDGYSCGRSVYYSEIVGMLNPDGTPHVGPYTRADLECGAVRLAQVRDLTVSDVMRYIRETLDESDWDASEAELFGCIVGYLTACVENFYGLGDPLYTPPVKASEPDARS